VFININQTKNFGEVKKRFLGIYDKFPHLLHVRRFVFSLLLLFVLVIILFYKSWGRLVNYYMMDIPSYGGTYSEGLVGKVDNLNPMFASTNLVNYELSSLIFSGLLKRSESGAMVPDLAYNYTVSEDGREYLFYLRHNARWQNHDEYLNSKDVVFTFKAIQHPDTKSPLKENWKGVEISAVDEWTVKFRLPGPNFAFTEMVTLGIVPEQAFSGTPYKNLSVSKFNLEPYGTGPFEFSNLQEKTEYQEVSLIGSNDYSPHPPYLDMNFKIYSERGDLMEAYLKKDISAFAGMSLEEYEASKKFKKMQYIEMRLPRYVGLFFNVKNDKFTDSSVRQAIAKAINRIDLLDQSKIAGTTVSYPILSGQIGYLKDLPKNDFNLEEAKKILDDKGWKLEGDYRKKDGKVLEFELLTNNSEEFKRVSSGIKDQLAKVGVKVFVKQVDVASMQNDYIKPRKYQSILIGESIGSDPDLYSYWHSTQVADPGVNLSVFSNEKLDKALETARQTKDLNLKKEKLISAQKIIMTETPAVFLYSPSFIFGVNKNFKGIKHVKMVDPASRYIGIEDWYLKTRKQLKIQ